MNEVSMKSDNDDKLSKKEKEYYGDIEGKYRAESDMHSLMQAAEIKGDEKRYEAAKFCMKEKRKSMDEALKSEGDS